MRSLLVEQSFEYVIITMADQASSSSLRAKRSNAKTVKMVMFLNANYKVMDK